MGIVAQSTFDTDPGAWLTLRANSGAFSWDSVGQFAQVQATATAQARWALNGVPALTQGEFELDFEFASTTASSGDRGIGIAIESSASQSDYAISPFWYGASALNGRYHNNVYLNNVLAAQILTPVEGEPYNIIEHKVGQRRTRVFKFKVFDNISVIEALVDGQTAAVLYVNAARFPSFIPLIWVGNFSVARVHSYVLRDDTDLAYPNDLVRADVEAFGRVFLPANNNDNNFMLRDPEIGRMDPRLHNWSGALQQGLVAWKKYRLRGTTKLNAPPLVNVAARVMIFDTASGEFFGETRSDPVTGEYVFLNLDHKRRYTVTAIYDNSLYRAVIADNIVPEEYT